MEIEITKRDLLTFNVTIITGMLFVFGLSSEIAQRNVIIYGMTFPILISILAMLMILTKKDFEIISTFTQLSLCVLFGVIAVVFIDVIVLDNYISDHITLKSWMGVDKII